MQKLSVCESRYGPFSVGRTNQSIWQVYLESNCPEQHGEDSLVYGGYNRLVLQLGRWCILGVALPYLVKVHTKQIHPGWGEEITENLGRSHHWDFAMKKFGVSLSGGEYLELFYGVQSEQDEDERRWQAFMPWVEQRMVRHEYYDHKEKLHWRDRYIQDDVTRYRALFEARQYAITNCPTVDFVLSDTDGLEVLVKTKRVVSQFSKAIGKRAWLSWFLKDEVECFLELSFDRAVGLSKHTWRDGTLCHSVGMLKGESRVDCIQRYCALPRYSRQGDYFLKFVKAL